VVFDLPGCAVVNSHFLLWLQQFPLELHLEVVPHATDVCAPGPWKNPDGTDQALSTNFELSDCEIKADLLILDSGIVESVSKAVAGGTPSTCRCASGARRCTRSPRRVAAGRRTSRGRTHASRQRTSPSGLPRRRLPRQGSGRRATSSLVTTAAAKMDLFSAPTYNFTRDSYRMQVSVGSVLYPLNPIRSCAEQYSQLVKAVGALQEAVGLIHRCELPVQRAHRGH
jgi:hypothetical protein